MDDFFMDAAPPASSAPPTRDPQEALRPHRIAATNLKHINSKLHGINKPRLSDVYLGNMAPEYAPPRLDLYALFLHFNTLAFAGFVALPNSPIIVNELSFYYNMDVCHSFNTFLDQGRLDVILAMFIWAHTLTPTGQSNQMYVDSQHFWQAYILAWMESLVPGATFDHRTRFIESWQTSKSDLVRFTKAPKKRMLRVLKDLAKGKAPKKSEILAFLAKCMQGVDPQEFARVGPAMSIHYALCLEHEGEVKHKQKKNVELIEEKMRKRLLGVSREQLIARLEKEEGLLHFSDDEDDEDDDEMEVDDGCHVYAGIDLTQVDWDAEIIQALLSVDTEIDMGKEYRPDSGRKGWIGVEEGYNVLFSPEDQLVDGVREKMGLSE
jgi:hypothetical protein